MKNIKSFDDLFDNIAEALDQPLPVKWIKSPTNWVGVFSTNENEYNIVISNQEFDVWKFKYFIKKENKLSTELTNLNYDVFKVLSTIYKSIYDFIDELDPNGIIFGAENDSPTRVKLYSRFSSECSKKYGYKVYTKAYGNDDVNPTLYVLYRTLSPDELFSVVKKVTDEELGI